jgi:hypothetical protein
LYIKGEDWIWFFVVVVIFQPVSLYKLLIEKPCLFFQVGQSRTAFGLLKAPELQRLSVTVEVLSVGVMIVGEMTVGVLSVGVMTVGVLSVGVMTLSLFFFIIFIKDIVTEIHSSIKLFADTMSYYPIRRRHIPKSAE